MSKIDVSAQVTGFMTLSKSKLFDDKTKAQLLEAPEGQERVIRKVLVDPKTGQEVVFNGKARLSKSGSITSNFAVKLDGIEFLLVDAKLKANKKEEVEKKETDLDQLASSIGLEELVK